MKRSSTFTRGIVILTLLLLSVVVSFFMGKILGNELMAGGREKLEPFTAKADEQNSEEAEPELMGAVAPDHTYEGPTSDKFELSWATLPEDDTSTDTTPISIEPVDKPGEDGEGASSGESGNASLFGLDDTGDEGEKVVFRVQVGVFSVLSNAEKLAVALRQERYSAYTQQIESPGGEPQWKVFVGPFESLEAANEAAEQLRERSYKAFVK